MIAYNDVIESLGVEQSRVAKIVRALEQADVPLDATTNVALYHIARHLGAAVEKAAAYEAVEERIDGE